MDCDPAMMRLQPMFPEINPLPGSQCQFTTIDRNRKIDCRKRGSDMGGHIVVSFGCVDEYRIAIGHQPRKKCIQIPAHIRIGILLD